jgi:hypothetical protein
MIMGDSTDDLRPWDRQPGESSPAYEAYLTYQEMGADRSSELVARKLGKSKTLTDRWCSQWKWVERARQWDCMPSRAVADAFQDMAARIAAQHERVATKLMAKLEKNIDLLPEGVDPTVRLSTALGAARQSHQFATDLSKPADDTRAEISKAIENLISKLAGEE